MVDSYSTQIAHSYYIISMSKLYKRKDFIGGKVAGFSVQRIRNGYYCVWFPGIPDPVEMVVISGEPTVSGFLPTELFNYVSTRRNKRLVKWCIHEYDEELALDETQVELEF